MCISEDDYKNIPELGVNSESLEEYTDVELEQLSEATLMETLITQEDKDSMRQEIENLFKKSS